jgi:hypothetical protein
MSLVLILRIFWQFLANKLILVMFAILVSTNKLLTKMTISEFFNLFSENKNIAIYAVGVFIFLIFLIYMFLKNIFSDENTTEARMKSTADASLANSVPNIIADEDLVNYTERLQLLAKEGTLIATRLEKQVAEKGQELKDMETYMEQLRTQEAAIKTSVEEAGVAPVPLLNQTRLAVLQKKAKQRATLMLWVGLLLGVLVGLASMISYVHFILKVPILKPLLG